MAYIQIQVAHRLENYEEPTEDILAVSQATGGIIVIKGENSIVRLKLDKKEAAHVAAKLAPHIP